MAKKRMAIDFDGVIHAYTQGWQDGVIYDQPVEGALETMEALSRLYDVYIFTTRGSDPVQVEAWLFRCAIESGDPIWLVVPSYRLVRVMDRMFAAGRF